ncbi:MAG: glycosyltransferase family 4 protein [Actinomycetota bacterium]|nr:glycosyltransferase family 4 protein [Actinomycetota bacterium]
MHEVHKGHIRPSSINWFIPDFESPFYGGINTIFRFADQFQERFGVKNRFLVVGSGPEEFIRSGMRLAFPALEQKSEIVVSPRLMHDPDRETPWADVSIATFWLTAYALSRVRSTKRKFYFIQDYEPIFYPAGTTSALTEQSYRMGLYGICNTKTLKEIYEGIYGGRGTFFVPALDGKVFHPRERLSRGDRPYRVFLYARPSHPRNCYELAATALRGLKESLREGVEIVTAGSWVPLEGKHDDDFMHHLGLLDYAETAELYRTCDVGLVLSVSRHPSYLPLELMASGCLVVSNFNPATTWLLKHEENSLLSPPLAERLHLAMERGLRDDGLRQRLVNNGLTTIQANHSSWEPWIEKVFRYLCDPEGSSSSE